MFITLFIADRCLIGQIPIMEAPLSPAERDGECARYCSLEPSIELPFKIPVPLSFGIVYRAGSTEPSWGPPQAALTIFGFPFIQYSLKYRLHSPQR